MTDYLNERTTTTKEIFNGKMISLQEKEVILPNGNTANREIVKHPGAVAVLPITKEGDIIFVEQFRKAVEQVLLEIPAGKIELNEAKEKTAVRELEEEIGYTTEDLQYVTSFYTSPGFANEMIHLYYTKDLIKLNQRADLDEDEFLEIKKLSLQEAEKYMQDVPINDVKTMYALLYCKLFGLDASC
ncbi:MAG TPA: NUDIX hydrolase [Pseudogracilibacillus sp.]|nr:NUDIX hydrolase [Pseudogracilibacillus sp.]